MCTKSYSVFCIVINGQFHGHKNNFKGIGRFHPEENPSNAIWNLLGRAERLGNFFLCTKSYSNVCIIVNEQFHTHKNHFTVIRRFLLRGKPYKRNLKFIRSCIFVRRLTVWNMHSNTWSISLFGTFIDFHFYVLLFLRFFGGSLWFTRSTWAEFYPLPSPSCMRPLKLLGFCCKLAPISEIEILAHEMWSTF